MDYVICRTIVPIVQRLSVSHRRACALPLLKITSLALVFAFVSSSASAHDGVDGHEHPPAVKPEIMYQPTAIPIASCCRGLIRQRPANR